MEHFWHQFGNSLYMGAMTVLFTLLIGTLASFAIGRMRIRHGWLITNAALLTYVIPASFLAIPFYLIMQNYGLENNIWAVIAALVTFATPYAIFIFLNYAASIPLELDEAVASTAPPDAGVLADLPAADGAGPGCRGNLCAAVCRGTNSSTNTCCCRTTEHDGRGSAGAIPQQR